MLYFSHPYMSTSLETLLRRMSYVSAATGQVNAAFWTAFVAAPEFADALSCGQLYNLLEA
jgi:hypothetical protein